MSAASDASIPRSVFLVRGPRAGEASLLDRIRRHADAARLDPGLLARPLRVVVPSRSLREHLSARVVTEIGAVAGLRIQTLFHLAHEVLRAAAVPPPGIDGRILLPVLVRRAAAEEPVLREVLDHLEDGYAAAVASVSDLLDAGFEPSLLPALLESFEAEGGGAVVGRARALVRVAAKVREALAAEGRAAPADLFVAARRVLERDATRLPASGVLIHGYADATGVQADLLETLVRQGAEAWVDVPPDPVAPERPAPGEVFAERLRARLAVRGEGWVASDPGAPRFSMCRAPGAHAEVRAVADRLFRLVHREGVRPERIGVVVRDLAAYRVPLRVHLRRMGVPFSGGRGSLAPEGRRARALLELLDRGDRCAADRWLDAWDRMGRLREADLRLALHGMGLGRVRDVAERLEELLGDASHYVLPVRQGLEARSDEAGQEAEGGTARRRIASRATLEQAWTAARDLRARLARLADAAALGPALAELRGLLTRALAWRPGTEGAGEVFHAMAVLEAELGPDLGVSPAELRLLLRRALEDVGRAPLGGRGGGVQLLSVTEARGRTFQHLFVLGLNRGVFPRPVTDDPLLPDRLRQAALTVLPDLPVKQRGFDEERYLFAQLLAAAEVVELSWQAVSDDGKERTASPLVERLRLVTGVEAPSAADLLEDRAADLPRPVLEHAVREGRDGGPARLRPALEVALAEGPAAADSASAAHARAAAVEEHEGLGARRRKLGPWFGFVGPVRDRADPRGGPLYVTRLEALHYCPWQAFLQRVLALEPVPDALAGLPDVTPLLLGDVVHAVLEKIVARAGAPVREDLDALAGAAPVEVAWPGDAELQVLLDEAAQAAARREGIVLPGFARLLAARALPMVERARDLDWGPHREPCRVIGAELEGRLRLPPPRGRTLHFRVDRADAGEEGLRVLVDYKTGRSISDHRRADTRRRKLLEQVASGRRLQAPLYAHAGGEGRYLFLKEDTEDDCARVVVRRDDEELTARLQGALDALLDAWEAGVFPPRLLDPSLASEGAACAWCDVADACLRGDTGSRMRLARWLTEGEAPSEGPERVARRLAEQVGWKK